jgi:hypothetical protein
MYFIRHHLVVKNKRIMFLFIGNCIRMLANGILSLFFIQYLLLKGLLIQQSSNA